MPPHALAREFRASNLSYKVQQRCVSGWGAVLPVACQWMVNILFLILSQKNSTVLLSEDRTLRTVAVSEVEEKSVRKKAFDQCISFAPAEGAVPCSQSGEAAAAGGSVLKSLQMGNWSRYRHSNQACVTLTPALFCRSAGCGRCWHVLCSHLYLFILSTAVLSCRCFSELAASQRPPAVGRAPTTRTLTFTLRGLT